MVRSFSFSEPSSRWPGFISNSIGMRARSARRSTDSMKERFSNSRRNVNTSPPLWQPKQWKICLEGETLKLGVFSLWNGQRARKFVPARLSGRTELMMSTMSLAWRTCSIVAWGMTGKAAPEGG